MQIPVWKTERSTLSKIPTWGHHAPPETIHIIPTLNLGGAEKIVLDLISQKGKNENRITVYVMDGRASDTHEVNFNTNIVKVEVLTDPSWKKRLQKIASDATGRNLPVYCHLSSSEDMTYLQHLGVRTIPVIHNDTKGWTTDYLKIFNSQKTPFIAVCSHLIGNAVKKTNPIRPVKVLRHNPQHGIAIPKDDALKNLGIPESKGPIIGMIGRIAVQKNYIRAVTILAALKRKHPDSTLVIIGPWSFRDGKKCKEAIEATAETCGLKLNKDVILTGGLPNASSYLSAFDIFLNTSLWEGLSMACLEATQEGIPVIASRVGGQEEIGAGCTLLDLESPNSMWVEAIEKGLSGTMEKAPNTYHTQQGLAQQWPWAAHFSTKTQRDIRPEKVLFLTLDLNMGGAQKSLCNLLPSLAKTNIRPILAINGKIGVPEYLEDLDDIQTLHLDGTDRKGLKGRINSILTLTDRYKCGTICFWNVDALTKSIIANILDKSPVKMVDVSPGPMLYSELDDEYKSQNGTSLTRQGYLDSLAAVVNKYTVENPQKIKGKTWSIPNGVKKKAIQTKKNPYKIAVSGRLSESKYPSLLPEIARELQKLTKKGEKCLSIHVYGGFHAHHPHLQKHFQATIEKDGPLPDNLVFHGPTSTPEKEIADAACLLMLSKNQGCPNASLEALSLGIPVIANQTGGVSEQVITGKTGILLPEIPPTPKEIAQAIFTVCSDAELRLTMSKNAKTLVAQKFSMNTMATNYANLFNDIHSA